MSRPYKVFAERGPPGTLLTHACIGMAYEGLCGRMPPMGFNDYELDHPPSCPKCLAFIARMNAIGKIDKYAASIRAAEAGDGRATPSEAWSIGPPTLVDWYWWRDLEDETGGERPHIVRVQYVGQDPFGQPELKACRIGGGWSPVDEWSGLWQRVKGPEP